MSKRLCGAVLLGQVLDAVTFAIFFLLPHHVESGQSEQNWIIASLLLLGGPVLVVGVKEAVGYAVWIIGPHIRPNRLFTVAAGIAAFSGFVGASFNTLAIWRAM
jgi:hypothetical protein